MRLDKFLKVSRLAKRRSEAKEALEAGRVESRGRVLKPSYEVKVGEELLIHYATRDVLVRIEAVPEKITPRLRPESMFTILATPGERGSRAKHAAPPTEGRHA